MDKTAVRASVHAVVEYALRCGDLLPGASAERLLEGVRGHRSLQSVEGEGIRNEVAVRTTVESQQIALTVYGRIDRLYDFSMLEEIKTVLTPPADADPLHWAQAECYAYMLCRQENLPQIDVRITYLNLSDGEITRFVRTLTQDELLQRFHAYTASYLTYLEELHTHRIALRKHMQQLSFPYSGYRAGQRELAAEIYRVIRDKKMLLAQAPTGIGKTIAALFPALKGIGEGLVERIFYLTARSTARQAAWDALLQLPHSNLRVIALSARENLCIHEHPQCRSGLCPRQKGYYDRLPEALKAARSQDGMFTRDALQSLADAYCLCPFEFSLDLSLECDVIICDYNYLFDPRVRLQRYASGGRKGQVLLIDEAHNLPDRARSMYSAELSIKTLDAARKSIEKTRRKEPLYLALRALIRTIQSAADNGEIPRAEHGCRAEIVAACESVLAALKESDALAPENSAQLMLDLTGFLYHVSRWDEDDYLLFSGGKTTRILTLFCADASKRTAAVLKRSRAAILFSATLMPMEFYRTLTGAAPDARCVYLLSPFPAEHLLTLHLPVSTRYRFREQTLPRVASAIAAFVFSRSKGTFIAFFPSYAYMEKARELIEMQLDPATRLLVQSPNMTEEDRAAFLNEFSPQPTSRLLMLGVLGGIFSEGVDLPADRLCGVVIVGVGLPQIGVERDTLRQRYEESYSNGYAYAYTYPGLCKVMQAAGRIIRTEHDRGALLLIDDRYSNAEYQALLPAHWTLDRVYSDLEIQAKTARFFQKTDGS